MSRPPNFDERLVKTVKLWRLQLIIIEAEKVVHDDVARKCWEGIGQIQRLLASLKFLDSYGKSVDVSVDDVDEV